MWEVVGYIVLVAFGAGLIGVIFRPEWAFVLAVVMFPVKQLMGAYLPIFVRISPLFNLLVFSAVLIAVGSRALKRERPLAGMYNPLTVVTLVLYGWATAALLWTPGNGVARWLDGYAYWGMYVLLLPMTLLNLEHFRRTLPLLLVVGTIAAVLYYTNPKASWYSGRLTILIAAKGAAMEIRGNSLTVSQMGGMVAIAAAMMLPLRGGLAMTTLRIVAILTGVGLSVVSGARAQAALSVLTIVLFYPMSRRVKSLNQFFLVAGGMGGLLTVIFIGFTLFLGQGSEQSRRWDISRWWDVITSRAGDAGILIEAYLSHPQNWLQGLGTNAMSYFAGIPVTYAHNAPVEMLCELGLIGLTLYIVACVLAFRMSRRLFQAHAEDPVDRATVAVLLAITFYSFTLSLKQYTFVAVPEPWWLWLVVAKLWTRERRAALAAWQAEAEYEEPLEPETEPAPAA
jgi:hypothetical protein